MFSVSNLKVFDIEMKNESSSLCWIFLDLIQKDLFVKTDVTLTWLGWCAPARRHVARCTVRHPLYFLCVRQLIHIRQYSFASFSNQDLQMFSVSNVNVFDFKMKNESSSLVWIFLGLIHYPFIVIKCRQTHKGSRLTARRMPPPCSFLFSRTFPGPRTWRHCIMWDAWNALACGRHRGSVRLKI